MKIKQTVLLFYALLFIGFGMSAMLIPKPLTLILSIQLQAPAASIEFMATYGGLFLGLGAYMLYCLKNSLNLGLVSVLATMGAMLIARASGAIIYGGVDLIQSVYMIGELFTLILICGLLYKPKTVLHHPDTH